MARAANLAVTLNYLGGLLGLLQEGPEAFLKGGKADVSDGNPVSEDEHIEQQIQARIDAKKAKDWALADKIRDELKRQGIILEDSPNGATSWRRE